MRCQPILSRSAACAALHRAAIVWVGLAALAGAAEPEPRCVTVDVFAVTADEPSRDLLTRLEAFAGERGGVVVVPRFVDTVAEDRAALAALADRHGFAPGALPVVHACGVALPEARTADAVLERLRAALRVEVYTRPACTHCAAAKAWLPTLRAQHPALEVVYRDITNDKVALADLVALVKKHRTKAASVPVFHLCDTMIVGFDRVETSGPRLIEALRPWTRACRPPIGVPEEPEGVAADESIDLPWLGRLDARRLGMPLFTLAIGLVDGFNPCAMWVLLLLLSILVNLRDRVRILAIAGTFVLVSGVAYFAFMAAWLNVFQWIGMLRPVQLALGAIAVAIGGVHVKDFFAFHAGPSLSIPESAKPGIYARIRRIVNAENLAGALAGALVLAVLVNMVELLCTAGLPALYTAILEQRGYSMPVRYAYLALYIAAYMFDDALMVTGVVASLSRVKLQESGGRWLKLVSGAVILAIGLTMLLRPEWLGV